MTTPSHPGGHYRESDPSDGRPGTAGNGPTPSGAGEKNTTPGSAPLVVFRAPRAHPAHASPNGRSYTPAHAAPPGGPSGTPPAPHSPSTGEFPLVDPPTGGFPRVESPSGGFPFIDPPVRRTPSGVNHPPQNALTSSGNGAASPPAAPQSDSSPQYRGPKWNPTPSEWNTPSAPAPASEPATTPTQPAVPPPIPQEQSRLGQVLTGTPAPAPAAPAPTPTPPQRGELKPYVSHPPATPQRPRTVEPTNFVHPPAQTTRSRPALPQQSSTPAKAVPAPEATQATPHKPPGNQKKPVKPRPPRFKDRAPRQELAITEIAGHLTFTANTVTAWYWLPEVRWAFRPDSERENLIIAIAEQYAGLAGFRLHLRRTTRPFPIDEWARTIAANTPNPLPPAPGAPTWADHLISAQRHLLAANASEGQTYLGITFARRTFRDVLAERFNHLRGKGTSEKERARNARLVEQFDEILGSFGVRARRATPHELEWLIYRSVALGMSPPTHLSPVSDGHWESGDLLALTEHIERYRTPYGSTVKLVNRLTGEERHVCVLTVGRMEPLEIPEVHEPWLHFHERLPWPMELSSRVDVLGPGDAFRNLEHRLRMIRSQQRDYQEHGIDAPPELERLAQRALRVGDEMTTGLPLDASRIHGWHRLAVSGRTREECLERARRVIKMYSRDMRISLQHPKNQDLLVREFIPGEPVANTGYLRRMPVRLFAAALPQAASIVGDRRGDLIGRTAGTSRRPVFLDLHFPTEVRERSGLAVFVAEPGGGKSTLIGALGYLAARRGVQVTLLDPSGPLARLCQMPELRPYSRVLNLTGSEHGTLAPYALIPTPQRSHFPEGRTGDREYEIALSNARAERRMLVQDICSMLVPPQVAREARTATLLRHAVRQVPAEETSTLDDLIQTLSSIDDDGRELANLLLDTAEMPLALLFFGQPPEGALGDDAALTVITMAGLRLPDLRIEREYWSAEEQLALPMLHTAHRLAVRRCYGGDMRRRKLVGLDEAHFMEGWRSGRSFLVRLARDSRKWNLAALVASQNPRDILGLDVQNLVSTVFVGRIAEDHEIAADALRMLRVPRGVGYEQTLATLSAVDPSSQNRLPYREFVMRDVDGRVQRIRVDISYVPGLLEHLDTTPTPQPRNDSNAIAPIATPSPSAPAEV